MKMKMIIAFLFLLMGISSQAQEIFEFKSIKENTDYIYKKADKLKTQAINEGEASALRIVSALILELNNIRSLLSQDIDKKLGDVNTMLESRLNQINKILNSSIAELNTMATNQMDDFFKHSTDFLNDLVRVFGRSVDLYANKINGLEQSLNAYGNGYQIDVNLNKTPSEYERKNIQLFIYDNGKHIFTVAPSSSSGSLSKVSFKLENQHLDKYFLDTRIRSFSVKLNIKTYKVQKKVLKDEYSIETKSIESFMFLLPKYPYQFKLVQKITKKKEVVGTKPIYISSTPTIIKGTSSSSGRTTIISLSCNNCRIDPNSIRYFPCPEKECYWEGHDPKHRWIKWRHPEIKHYGQSNGQILEVSVNTRFKADREFRVSANYFLVSEENTMQTYSLPIQYASNSLSKSSAYLGYGEYHTQTLMNGYDQYELILVPTINKSSVSGGQFRLINNNDKISHSTLGTVQVEQIGSTNAPTLKITISKPRSF